MTQIIDGYAQPDIEAINGDKHLIYFVETPNTLKINANALKKSLIWIHENYPNASVDLICTAPKIKRKYGRKLSTHI